jgi:TP901 family phage tail tape measure protein
MADDNLSIRATLTVTDEMSPVLQRVLNNLRKIETAAKRFNATFASFGNAGVASMNSFDRAAKAASTNMREFEGAARSASRSYAADWRKAMDARLSESRRAYGALEKMESGYRRQLERTAAVERRADRANRLLGRPATGIGRLPAPSPRSMLIGGIVAGAGIGSAIKKRIETEAAEVRSQLFGDLDKSETAELRRSWADRAGIRFGTGTSKALDATTEGLKAGIAKQYAGEFGELALKAQAGLDIPSADVAKLLGRLSTQMPWNQARFSKVLNAIAVANNATAADGSEIVEAMRRSLSALASTKMTPEQLAAIDATNISLGIQPFKAGTFLSFLTSQVAGADSTHGQQAKDLSGAANSLGFGGRAKMAHAMRNNPVAAIQQMLDRLGKMPEALRTKVAKQIGGREWMDELLTMVLGRDKLKDVLSQIDAKPGFLDSAFLQKIKSMAGRWAFITAAFGLVWEKIGAGFDSAFEQITDAIIDLADRFNFETIKQHIAALIDGLREGFDLKSWADVVNAVASRFDAGTVAKWKAFATGFGEGLRESIETIKGAFNAATAFVGGSNDPKAFGKATAKLATLFVTLAVLSPVITAFVSGISIIVGSIMSLTIAISALANSPIGLAVVGIAGLAFVVKKALDYVSDKIFAVFVSLVDSVTSLALQIINKVRGWVGLSPIGDRKRGGATGGWDEPNKSDKPTAEPQSFIREGRRAGEAFRKAAFIDPVVDLNRSLLQNAAFTTVGGGNDAGVRSVGGGGRISLGSPSSDLGAPTNLLHSAPGKRLPKFGVGPEGIIRRDRIPSFNGGGGSQADPGPAPSFAVDPGISGNAYLAARRARFKRELDENPELKKRLAAVIDLENPGAGTAVAESLMNRMDMTGGSIARGIGGGSKSFYGPVRRGLVDPRLRELERNPSRMAARMKQIDEAITGSNLIRGHTDQGSAGDPNYVAGGTGVNINRERFNDWGGGRWAGKTGHAASRAYRDDLMRHVQGQNNPSITSQVPPRATDVIKNVPSPIRGDASLGLIGNGIGSGSPVSIHINGSNHDPESLAALVQRRVEEANNWRTHDTASEYT